MKFLTSKAILEINANLNRGESSPMFSGSRVSLDDLKEYSKVRIVFSEEAYTKLLQLFNKQKNIGTYFYGKVFNNLVFISTSLSDYDVQRGTDDSIVSYKKTCYQELKLMTEASDVMQKPFSAVIDFQIRDINAENDLEYMDSDLYSYAYQQLYLQPMSKNSVVYFGMILVKENDVYKLRCVFYDSLEHTFIKISNIYYLCNREMHKFNNDSIDKFVELTVNEKQDILRKLKAYKGSGK